MQDRLLQIGEVADRVGLSLRTVRYYEEMGLLVPEKRTEGGFRLFTDGHVDRLLIIKRMKPLEFTVPEMREVLEARDALRDVTAGEGEQEAARVVLETFADAAAERLAKLRRKLADAEGFTELLRLESSHGRPSSSTLTGQS